MSIFNSVCTLYNSDLVAEELVGQLPVVDGVARLLQPVGQLPPLRVDDEVRGGVRLLHVLVGDAEPQAVILENRSFLQQMGKSKGVMYDLTNSIFLPSLLKILVLRLFSILQNNYISPNIGSVKNFFLQNLNI